MAFNNTEGEKELIKKIVDGDEQAFSILFFRYLPVLNSFAVKFTKSTDAAQEIIQDAFVRVWLNRDKLEQVENIKAYLYKYVSNECLGYLRKKLKDDKIIDNLKITQQHISNNTAESIHLNEIKRIVSFAVDKLPNQRRKIYQLSRNEGKTIPEIADQLGISINTVKNSLVSALKYIRIELSRHGITLLLGLILYTL
ncbi:RNA polymerase sigma-70 factor [Pedobacter chinensis]|uniref:RNA polymerase sigma-70 factor n=1 Tax=Pedobacter chinensis TaxID=2282421 RepID=A0A369PW93_9SPHI|nr:RNA polymerase sigma-70 factor [Pedobacter chinensis]RDC54959.1 RNA polymerase sigma-70 factor [Pedobacter chinensis]